MWHRRGCGAQRGALTQVIVLSDGCRCPGPGALLGKVVTKLGDARVLLQHLGDLHLSIGSQLLPLQDENKSITQKPKTAEPHICPVG